MMIFKTKKCFKRCFLSITILLLAALIGIFVFYDFIVDADIQFYPFTQNSVIIDSKGIPDYNDHYANNRDHIIKYQNQFEDDYFKKKNITAPIIIWWTPFTLDLGSYKYCGEKRNKCFLTNVRKYRDHENAKAFLYYGSDFYLNDLPLPRRSHEEWGLLHEESPKNNFLFSFERIMKMFNHTATFKRESDLPLVTQYLTSIEDIEDEKFFKTIKHKNRMIKEFNYAPVAYIQSDCYTPSNRDSYVKTLMQYIKVDSYGTCIHNKDLPQEISVAVKSMSDEKLYEILSNYKFILSIENAICDDYVTEKLWRTYYVGSVPIVLANNARIDDYLPTNISAINIKDFKNAEELAKFLHNLNENDEEYEKYTSYKGLNGVKNEKLRKVMNQRKWAINNDRIKGNFIDEFECLVCERLHENLEREANNEEKKLFLSTKEHYGCPHPITFDTKGSIITINDAQNASEDQYEIKSNDFNGWGFTYLFAYSNQCVFFKYLEDNYFNFTSSKLRDDALKHYHSFFVKNKSSKADLK